ncbi:MAG: hypothetical protein J0I80_10355 [Sphingomonas sp.]|nr:hypothetical protein [Sphingomonas sp.]
MKPALALPLLAALAACSGAKQDQAPDNAGNEAVNAAAPASSNAAGNVAEATPQATPTAFVLDRFGPIRVGATIAALDREGLHVAGRDEPLEGSTCGYATFKGQDDVAAMLDGDRVVRIDVSGAAHEGPGGLRVGQSEADALRRLGSQTKVQPHPYTGPEGHYLILHADGAPNGLIVETDGKTVQSWRIGHWDQVQWIEGCS